MVFTIGMANLGKQPHDLASSGFGDGERYHSTRPDYPRDAVKFLVDTMGIDDDAHVLDLGAGTGIFTEQLLPFCDTITAVEPTPGMRNVLSARLPTVKVLDGRDIDIPLESSSVDCVVVAQAFHWFDAPAALEEIHRVLVEGGRLGLLWNERDETVPWVAELGQAMHWPTRQPYLVGQDFTAVLESGPFVNIERRKFAHRQVLDHEGLIQRVLSTSYVAVMDADEQASVIRDVKRVVAPLPAIFELPYITDVYRATAMLR
ncbi:MAG TPA: class I SAM-dependent methyltransferase [Acidimicrobiales bacterium]|nr:class I SAM-dependent methyltransferase [Acidimicrobiales bacterium]